MQGRDCTWGLCSAPSGVLTRSWPGHACGIASCISACRESGFVGFCFLFLFLFFNVKKFFTQVILTSKRKQTEANIRKYKP